MFLFYLKGAFRPVRDLAKYAARLSKAAAAADRISEVFQTPVEVSDSANAPPLVVSEGRIEFRHLSFAYEPGKPVIRDLSLCIEPGEHVVVVGASGHGKSTLSALLLRLFDPEQGEILIDGQRIREVQVDSLRSAISTVLQDTSLFAGSVYDNIALATENTTPAAVQSAARLANAASFIEALPNRYDTLLGERGVNLSSGQRQRIAIARAALRNGRILILDEPTSGLDLQNEAQVLSALMRLGEGRTTLHITHRIDAAARADRVILIEHGQIAAEGSHLTLLRTSPAYRALFASDVPEEEPPHAHQYN